MTEEGDTRTASTVAEKPVHDEETAQTAEVTRPPEEHRLQPGESIDRYIVLGLLGSGGMGVVYKAYDPELDRRIALKVHRLEGAEGAASKRARDRLLREAQALAQLSHPNVVAAYDVGAVGDDVFVAMELVKGQTFKEWLKAAPRSQREIVDVLVAAGRGLAAAHAAGLIHRDFKPDNVLVGEDGRVRVADFGLARAVESSADRGEASGAGGREECDSDTETEELEVSSERRLGSKVTQLGTVVGTPGYMAPEQILGHELDAQTDQFAFCVTLYEALFGIRPFRGRDRHDLKMKVVTGAVEGARSGHGVPRRLRRIVLRGLSPAPEDRFPSMEALLAELSFDPAARRRMWALAAALVLLVGVATVAATSLRERESQLCRGADERVASVWGPERAAEVEKAFSATARPYAADTFARVKRELDRRGAAWATARTEACRATRVHGEQSERVLDLKMGCLDRRLGEMRALIEVFAGETDEGVVDHAVRATRDLPTLDRCADVESLLDQTPLPDDARARAEIAAARGRIERIEALSAAGKYEQTVELGEQVVEEARRIGYEPLLAEGLAAYGWAQSRVGKLDAALESLRAATESGAANGNDWLLARVAVNVYYVVGVLQRHFDEARALTAFAEAFVVRAGSPIELRADLLATKGYVLLESGDRDAARTVLEQALAITKEESLPFEAAHAHNLLGNLWTEARDFDRAAEHIERALGIWEAALGRTHPLVAVALNNLAAVRIEQARNDDARVLLERARAIYEAALGPEHPKVAIALLNIAQLLTNEGRCEQALPEIEHAQAIVEARYGNEHPYFGAALSARGNCLVETGAPDRAIPLLERALSIRSKSPAEDSGLATTRFALARALWKTGADRQRATDLARRARTAFTAHSDAADEVARVDAWLSGHEPR